MIKAGLVEESVISAGVRKTITQIKSLNGKASSFFLKQQQQ